ncbi:unnamed protein product [Meganyctiphanes norvegica]|uniref:ADP-ribosylation factor-like protein 2-binding protein n=1 Tax=Meganyctiphanes norvegica TaxID=48144 RepID=A0AAV2QG77_MEGNR
MASGESSHTVTNTCQKEDDIGSSSKNDEEEVLFQDESPDTLNIDSTIGHLENIIMSPEFASVRDTFMREYANVFEDTDENKLEYMDIYKQYTGVIECYIEEELSQNVDNFSMSEFMKELQSGHSLEGEVFDLLLTFTDFLAFKASMLEFKKSEENNTSSLENLLLVTRLGS